MSNNNDQTDSDRDSDMSDNSDMSNNSDTNLTDRNTTQQSALRKFLITEILGEVMIIFLYIYIIVPIIWMGWNLPVTDDLISLRIFAVGVCYSVLECLFRIYVTSNLSNISFSSNFYFIDFLSVINAKMAKYTMHHILINGKPIKWYCYIQTFAGFAFNKCALPQLLCATGYSWGYLGALISSVDITVIICQQIWQHNNNNNRNREGYVNIV